MNKLLMLSLMGLTLIYSTISSARELSTVDELARAGMQVRMGELTGAGSKFSLHKLEGLVLPEGVLMKGDCAEITVKSKADPKISDIVRITVDGEEIEASSFVGFVVR